MITMSEIAKLTHVSQPTVSRVLNGNTNVNPAVRERVLECARAHDYQLNALAKGLQGRKTQLLGVILTDISNGFFATLAKQIESEARKRNYSIILFNSDYNRTLEQEYMDVVRRYRVDGVLAVPIRENSKEWMDCVQKLDVPLVVVTKQAQELDSVHLDHNGAGELVARHLSERGYNRFLFVGRHYDVKYIGFQRGLAALGIHGKHCVQSVEFQNDAQLLRVFRQYFHNNWKSNPIPKGKANCEGQAEERKQENPPDIIQTNRVGIFAYNDVCAFHVLDVLRQLEIPVPECCGVMGFDDTEMGAYMNPRLSSVSQPIAQMAQQAVTRLLYRIASPGAHPVQNISLPATLSIKEST